MQKKCLNHDPHDLLEMGVKTKSCIRCSILEMHVKMLQWKCCIDAVF